ncbi:hypothetical protein MMC29_001740 [Sticta canariensis]|nr:hypothetical protein [Sticta canariensis]
MPIVTRSARRRAEEAQVPSANAPTVSVSERPRAAHGRRGASTTIFDTPQPDGERGLVENRNRSEGPSTFRNPLFSENNGANHYQDQEHLEQVQPDVDDANGYQTPGDLGNRHQGRFSELREWARECQRQHLEQEHGQGRFSELREWARERERQHVEQERGQPIDTDQSHEELGRPLWTEPPPDGNIEDPVEESMEQRDEAGDAMRWMEANAAEAAPDESEELRMIYDRCTSPSCPVPPTIPHERGIYLHDGEFNGELREYPFGLSNPPPAVWQMVHRLEAGTGQPGDQEAVDSFTRNHALVLSAQFPPPL